jgi:Uma2 family endonuclease
MMPGESDVLIVDREHLPFDSRAEQTMGMPAIRRRWTAAEVRALQDESRAWPRYELIGGELLVTPGPRPRHQFAVQELAVLLDRYVREARLGHVLTSPSALELHPESIVQPDVFVFPPMVLDEREPVWTDIRSLLLTVEVISPSSVRIDRVEKRDYYMDAEVSEYWVVDLDARQVERWRRNVETPEVVRETLEWLPSPRIEPLRIDLPALFLRIGLPRRL